MSKFYQIITFVLLSFNSLSAQEFSNDSLRNVFVKAMEVNKNLSQKKGHYFSMTTKVHYDNGKTFSQEYKSETYYYKNGVIYNKTVENETFYNGKLFLQILNDQKMLVLQPQEMAETLLKNNENSNQDFSDSISVRIKDGTKKIFFVYPKVGDYRQCDFEFEGDTLKKCVFHPKFSESNNKTIVQYKLRSIIPSDFKFTLKYFIKKANSNYTPSSNYEEYSIIDQRKK